jgi:Chromate transporter
MANGDAPAATIGGGGNSTSKVLSANAATSVANGPDAPLEDSKAKEKMIAEAAALAEEEESDIYNTSLGFGWRTGVVIIAVWLLLFIGAVLLREYAEERAWQVLGTFFYVGTIVFGGGPVVIPLLYQYIVEPGWAEPSAFLLGLAIINSMPG